MPFRSCIFYIFFSLWTIFCATFGSPIGLNKKTALLLGKTWANGSLFLLFIICNIKSKFKNFDKIPHNGCMLLSHHQSTWETIFFLAKIPNIAFVLKKELLKIPFYGWYLKNMGMIPVNRKGGAGEVKRVNDNIEIAIKNGKNVVIFPQGTRVDPLKPSVIKLKLSCLDIAKRMNFQVGIITLNSGYFWPKGFILKKSGTIVADMKDILDSPSVELVKEKF